MIRPLAALMLAWLCMPALARAVRLTPELRIGGGWTSNVNNSERRVESDTLGALTAGFTLDSEKNAPFTWSVDYAGTYQAYRKTSSRDQYQQSLVGTFRTPFGAATSLSGSARFEQTYDTGSGQFSSTSTNQGAVTRGNNDRIDRATVILSLQHRFGPRWSGFLSTNYRTILYNSSTRADLVVVGGAANLTYSLTRRQTVGGGLSVTRQTIESIGLSPEQSTDFANAFVSWSYVIGPRWNFQSRIGPTFIRSEDRDNPALIDRGPGDLGFNLIVPATSRITDVSQGNPWRVIRETTYLSVTGCPSAGGQGGVFLTTSCGTTAPVESIRVGPPPEFPVAPPLELGTADALVLTNPSDFDTESDSLTTFANIALVRRGELSTWATTLIRTDGGNLGGRTSTVRTTLSSSFRWEPAERWSLSFSGAYSKQESATETSQVLPVFVPVSQTTLREDGILDPALPDDTAVRNPVDPTGIPVDPTDTVAERRVIKTDNAVDVDTWTLNFAATREITRNLKGRMNVQYRNQDNKSQLVSTASSFDDWRVGFSLIYRFDPIVF